MSSYRNLGYRLYIGIDTLPSKKAIAGEPRLMRFKFVLFFFCFFFSDETDLVYSPSTLSYQVRMHQ